MADYFLKYNDRVSGPFPVETLKTMARDGLVTALHTLSTDQEHWLPAGQIPGLLKTASPEAPPLVTPSETATAPAVPPSKPSGAAGIGAHVLGHVSGGVQALLVKGRIGIKGVLITCMTAAAMTLILGLATIVISAMMGQANARLESGAYNIRNNPLAQAMLSQEHDRLSLSFLVHDILTLLQSLAVLAYFVFWAIALYQCWKTVQPLRAREPAMLTPGKAVGFLFIPVFGFYWVFPCLLGLGRHLVTLSQCDDHSQVQPNGPMMQGLGIASGMAFILYQFSTVVGGGFITMLLLIALLLLSFFYVRTAVTAANQLPAA